MKNINGITTEKFEQSDASIKGEKRKKALGRNMLLLVSVILTTIYLLWRIFYTLPLDESIPEIIFGVLLVVAEVVTSFTTFELFYLKYKSDKVILDLPEVDGSYYPHVDVFIATHNEPLDILYKTANACTYMQYPDKEKVHIYFCDDGNRESVAKLAEELGIDYLGLAGNKHAKSGNLNNALEKTNSPLIATFDADMIPQRTFLMKTVPYFLLPTFIKEEGVWRERREEELDVDYKIGLIQTPQSFYNPDLFQFNLYSEDKIPNEQDFFSREINIMRNASNAISYTGSNTVILRKAMEEIGGFPLNTITEDFETSIRIQKEQYITYATSEIQAAGLTTTDFKSMIKQRKRWGQGVIQSLQNTNAIFTRKLSRGGRITYLSSYLYWWSFLNRLIFILSPIMFALFEFKVVNTGFLELLVIWFPSYFFYTISFKLLSSNLRNNRWSQTVDTVFAPYLIIPVLLETLGIHEKKFKVTSKEKKERSDILYAIPHMILIILSLLAVIKFTWGKYGWLLVYSSIIIFWICYNLISLIYAVFFMMGRKAYRKSERIRADEDVVIAFGKMNIQARTVDLSDGGMLFFTETPIYMPADKTVRIMIQSEHYKCNLDATLVYVNEKDGKWNYAMRVKPVEEIDKREYCQFIYDRNHSLPMSMDHWSTFTDDLRRNIMRRIDKPFMHNRMQARIEVNRFIEFDNGARGFVHDYNYHYLTITNFIDSELGEGNLLQITIANDIVVKIRRTDQVSARFNAILFEVINLEELTEKGVEVNELIDQILSS